MTTMQALAPDVLDQVLRHARTHAVFKPEPIPDALLLELQALAQWGPTAFNCQPARCVFVRSPDAKARLLRCMSAGNVAKVASAPVTLILATDTQFYAHLPTQFPHQPTLADSLAADPARAQTTALRNSSLQGGYLILAARMLGLDCGPMSGFDAAALDAEFFPDGRWRTNFLINLGYGEPSALRPRGPRLPDSLTTLLV